ncbi:MAG: hypothetical protein JRJ76_12610 [Deltaproteobacteria bacterium]|nr:hypothetical protein [Deltaproteobacteria bacterium]
MTIDREELLRQDIIPVIFVRGTNYEMGHQYGYQAAAGIAAIKDRFYGLIKRLLGENAAMWSDMLKGFQYYIKAHTPEIIDEMIGIADGARAAGFDITYTDILSINAGVCVKSAMSPTATMPSPLDELPPRDYQEKYGIKADGLIILSKTGKGSPGDPKGSPDLAGDCSRWAAWGTATKDGRLICGDSIDGYLGKQVNIIAYPDDGYPFISGVHMFGELTLHPLMNNKGLWVAGGNIDPPRDIDRDFGLPMTLALRHLAQFHDHADSAREELLSIQHTGGRVHNAMLADTKGNAFVFELTAKLKTFRKPGDFSEKDWIASPNTYIIPENCELFEPPLQPFKTDPRINQLWTMFDKYKGQIDLDFGKMLYRHQDPEENTYYIGNRSNQRVNLGIPDDGDEGVYYQATGPAGRNITCGCDPQDHLDVTCTFYTLRLKSSEAAVVQESEYSAAERLAAADTAIKKLGGGLTLLPARLALGDLFSKACKEFEKGKQFVTDARLADGNEKRCLFGKALTSYTRAESKFREVYNHIHPPAENPEDLGLEPIAPPRPELKTFEEKTYRQILEEGI